MKQSHILTSNMHGHRKSYRFIYKIELVNFSALVSKLLAPVQLICDACSGVSSSLRSFDSGLI